MMTLALIGSFLALLTIGVPVAIALGGASLLYVIVEGVQPHLVVLHRMVGGTDSFPLLAIPFFIMAGSLMNSSGITARIFGFAMALVGWLRGGLGHVNVVASIIFAGMSGTAVADAAGLGMIEIKAMKDQGYDLDFSVGITGSSSTIGPIIPPSLPMVIYGVMANASIGQLFAAGVLPGLTMGLTLMAMVVWFAHTRNYRRDVRFSVSNLWVSSKRAFLPLLTPIILVGGMVTGVFTPTEAAIAATVYALALGVFVYRTLSLKRLIKISFETIETTAIILLIVAGASIFGYLITTSKITDHVADAVLAITTQPWAVLLLVNLFLLIVGCFMETIAAITILVPVLMPLVERIGVDPVHFGVIMVLNLMIGLLTPPVGMVLYVLARVANISLDRTTRACAPFLIPLLVTLGIVTYWPSMVMFLPNLFYK